MYMEIKKSPKQFITGIKQKQTKMHRYLTRIRDNVCIAAYNLFDKCDFSQDEKTRESSYYCITEGINMG